jgi:hypothetical protein
MMSERVLDLLRDGEARARMGQIASEIVQTKFDLQKNVTQLIEAYGIKPSEGQPLANLAAPALSPPNPAAAVQTQELHPD